MSSDDIRQSNGRSVSPGTEKGSLGMVSNHAVPPAKAFSMLNHRLDTDDPWPDQGLNRVVALVEGLQTSDADEVDWLEILFYLASRRSDCRTLAETAIRTCGSIGTIFNRPSKELRELLGLDVSITAMLAATKTCMKMILAEQLPARKEICSYAALMDYLALDLRHADEERLRILFLDQKCRLIKDEEIGRGTHDRVPIYPKEVTKRAAAYSASSVVLAHNHLADDPTPRPQEIQATLRTKGALEFLDIALHDHVIIARNRCLSMREEGLI